MALKVSVVGASGYAGAELVRLLSSHPKVKIACLMGESSAGEKFSNLYPSARGFVDDEIEPLDLKGLAKKAPMAFLALPHGQAMKLAPSLVEKGVKVVDLSGDFRLRDPLVYEKWYKAPHTAPEFLGRAVYGLPEVNREAVVKADLVANPGCYATSILLALLPLVARKAADPDSLIVDCKSGVSGAGRKMRTEYHFVEANENLSVYKPAGTHQHLPEIEQLLAGVAGGDLKLTMTPQLLPVSRGILTTAYGDLLEEGMSTRHLQSLYRDFYQGHPFVRVYEGDALPDLRSVRGGNFCHLGLRVDERTRRALVVSVIDNLGKGAAGQAVQNMNLMNGFAEDAGLNFPGFAP